MNKTAKEEIAASETNEICVSGDGTWKTRGHTSRIGVCSIIGDITGKVIDVEVLSSYYKGCDRWKSLKYGTAYQEWKKSHEPYCVKNHSGSSNKMEVEGMKRIFTRSLLERNAKYVKYIGDGDTKTFPELQNTVSYNLEKIECAGHIQKRMGARLRRLKLVNRGKKLSDGKNDMRKSIWAIYCHYRSTDEEPMHYFCPVGASSWCSYQKAKSSENTSYKHNSIVPTSVMDAVKPIFAELSSPKLLKKCLGGKTQNSNESFNSTVWKYCPKTSGSSKRIVDVAVNEAVVMYNDGMAGRLDIMKHLGCKLGHFSVTYAFQSDNARIKEAEMKSKSSTLDARRALRMRKKPMHEHFVETEGVTYEAGAF
ncbi:uncharacterized protein TNCV_4996791 [Trichonephila clavipes]|nr:uncharacterized protein TNCV_4996791 [Trichonephila clavipes]